MQPSFWVWLCDRPGAAVSIKMITDKPNHQGGIVISTKEQCVAAAVTETGCTPRAAKFVADVLGMWDLLEASARGLCQGDQTLLTSSVSPRGYSVRFPGFNSGAEHEPLQIARLLVDDLGQWPVFKGRIVSEDAPNIQSYERMLAAFKSVHPSTDGYDPLHVDDLIAVLNSRLIQ
jgi:uncharacterized protein YfbU (UPF0304 family)